MTYKQLRDFAFEDVKNPNVTSKTKWCEPFPFIIPSFPVRQRIKLETKSIDVNHSSEQYIPDHLPPFPPRHTYSRTLKKRSSTVMDENNKSDPISRKKRILAINSIQESLSKIEEAKPVNR